MFNNQEKYMGIPGFFPLIFLWVQWTFEAQPLTETMENKLKINVIVNAPDNPIFLLTASETYTALGFQPAIGDLLTIIPDKTHDIEAICNEQINSKAKCFLEVYKRELNQAMKQLDVFCSINKSGHREKYGSL